MCVKHICFSTEIIISMCSNSRRLACILRFLTQLYTHYLKCFCLHSSAILLLLYLLLLTSSYHSWSEIWRFQSFASIIFSCTIVLKNVRTSIFYFFRSSWSFSNFMFRYIQLSLSAFGFSLFYHKKLIFALQLTWHRPNSPEFDNFHTARHGGCCPTLLYNQKRRDRGRSGGKKKCEGNVRAEAITESILGEEDWFSRQWRSFGATFTPFQWNT